MPQPTKYAAEEVKFPTLNINPMWVYKYWHKRKFIDLHIYTNDANKEEPIYAHRIIIGSSSTVLQNLLNNSIELAPGRILEMKMDGVSRTTMDILVNAIYSGLVEGLNDNNVLQLLSAAQELALHDIQEECESYLKEKIGLDKCLNILSVAEDPDLINNCSHLLLTQIDQVQVNSNLSQLSENVITIIVKKGIATDLCSPLNLLSLVISWLQYDWNRMERSLVLFKDLLPLLDDNNIIPTLQNLLKLDRNQDFKKFKLEFMSKVLSTMATESFSASSSGATGEENQEEMTPIIVGTRSLSPPQTNMESFASGYEDNNYYATMADDQTMGVSSSAFDHHPMASTPTVGNLRDLPNFRLPFTGNDNTGTIVTRSSSRQADKYSSTTVTSSLLSPASLVDTMDDDDDQLSVSTVRSSSSSTNNNSIVCDESNNKLPKFFYLAGIYGSTRRLRSCNLEENGYKDEAPFKRCKYMDNCVVYHDKKVYVLGGQDGVNTSSEVHIYDLIKEKWSIGPPMTEGRCEFNCIVMDGYIYALGADQPVEVEVLDKNRRKKAKRVKKLEWQGTNSVERLKISGRTSKRPRQWEAVECMIYCRHNCGLAVLDNKLYAIGGNGATNGEEMKACRSVECFDPDTTDERLDKWSLRAPMKTPRIGLCAVAAWGKIYAMGGGSAPYNEKQKKYKTIEIFDPINNCWRNGPSMNKERQFFAGFLHNDHIYVVGGDGDGQIDGASTIERLELAQNRWSIVGYVGDGTLDDGQYWSVALLQE